MGGREARQPAGGPEIVLLDASGGAAWTNRAVVALAAEPAPEEGTQGIAVIAEIANFSAEPVRNLGVTLALDGAEVARGFVDVPAAGRARKRFVLTTRRAAARTRPRWRSIKTASRSTIGAPAWSRPRAACGC